MILQHTHKYQDIQAFNKLIVQMCTFCHHLPCRSKRARLSFISGT